jgi:hypothetical protein
MNASFKINMFLLKKIFFINPWSGVIGPNVVFSQIVEEALSRGHIVHVLCPQKDEIAARGRSSGCCFAY